MRISPLSYIIVHSNVIEYQVDDEQKLPTHGMCPGLLLVCSHCAPLCLFVISIYWKLGEYFGGQFVAGAGTVMCGVRQAAKLPRDSHNYSLEKVIKYIFGIPFVKLVCCLLE